MNPHSPELATVEVSLPNLPGIGDLAQSTSAESLTSLRQRAESLLNDGCHEEARAVCRSILEQAPLDPATLKILDRCPFDIAGLFDDEPATLPSAASGAQGAQPWNAGPDACHASRLQAKPTGRTRAVGAPRVAPPSRHIPPDLRAWKDDDLRQHLNSLLSQIGFRRLQQLGFHLQRNDYYSPLNDCDFLERNQDLWNQPDLEPPCIEWRLNDQLAVAREIAPFLHELRDVPQQPPHDHSRFGWRNNFWENADALAQYGLVRSRKPSRYVEIGCGWSSLLLKQALERNADEGAPCSVSLVEPYPNAGIFAHLPPTWTTHRSILQRAPIGLFSTLGPGDVLFYDGSHCAKVGSDVNWFFFQILPRLNPGVLIHIHDISMPQEYPAPWIFERGQTWNEQYLLQAFLMHNRAYRIVLANRYLFLHRAAVLESLYLGLQPVYGSSFWFQKEMP